MRHGAHARALVRHQGDAAMIATMFSEVKMPLRAANEALGLYLKPPTHAAGSF